MTLGVVLPTPIFNSKIQSRTQNPKPGVRMRAYGSARAGGGRELSGVAGVGCRGSLEPSASAAASAHDGAAARRSVGERGARAVVEADRA